ncbi:MAG: ATP-binding cassette domain-containing protein, partial [bacterium]|nr:ATP-binding cassette domain-containing protein [bacterium]
GEALFVSSELSAVEALIELIESPAGSSHVATIGVPVLLAGRGDARKAATGILERVGLENRLRHYPKQLSGGEQQRVAIGRAFALHPKVLFADEPTGNLDTATGAKVVGIMAMILDQIEHVGRTDVYLRADRAHVPPIPRAARTQRVPGRAARLRRR